MESHGYGFAQFFVLVKGRTYAFHSQCVFQCVFPSEMTVIKTNPTERILLKSLSICIWPLAGAPNTVGVQSVLLLLLVILFRLTRLKWFTALCCFFPWNKKAVINMRGPMPGPDSTLDQREYVLPSFDPDCYSELSNTIYRK